MPEHPQYVVCCAKSVRNAGYVFAPMTAADFRRIALSLEGVEEYSHAGLPAFRVGGRKFASLASQAGGYGNLMLTLEPLWTVQQMREAWPYTAAHRFLLFDRDAKFGSDVGSFVKDIGIRPVRTAFRSPWQNGVATDSASRVPSRPPET
jgi:hypothetical protein